MPTPETIKTLSGSFGPFVYSNGTGICECGEEFELKPYHLKYYRPCWHLDRLNARKEGRGYPSSLLNATVFLEDNLHKGTFRP